MIVHIISIRQKYLNPYKCLQTNNYKQKSAIKNPKKQWNIANIVIAIKHLQIQFWH